MERFEEKEQFEERHYTKEQSDIHMSYCYGHDGSGKWILEDRTMVYNTIWSWNCPGLNLDN